MKMRQLTKWVGAIACTCFAVISARAITLDVGLTDPLALGDVIHGIQAGGQVNRDVIMVNNLLTLAPGTQSSSIVGDVGDLYQRSLNFPGALPAATGVGAVIASGITDGSALLSITLAGSFQYLVAAYDGPNGGVEIWNIGGLAPGTTIEIPRYAEPTGPGGSLQASTRYLMTGWSLLNPGTPPNGVPDGGSTALLLGTVLAGLGLLKARIK